MTETAAIRESFSRAAQTYDRGAVVQREAAARLADCAAAFINGAVELPSRAVPVAHGAEPVAMLTGTEQAGPLVLDAGCGTGGFAFELRSRAPRARIVACDIALPMLEKARETLAAPLAVADCAHLPFADAAFDIIASNLAFQWANPFTSFTEAARTLKPGGLLLFTTLGPETLTELRRCCREADPDVVFPVDFLSSGELLEMLPVAGLEPVSFECTPVFKRYADPLELVRALKEIGAAPPLKSAHGLSGAAMLRRAGKAYSKRFPAPGGPGVIATYEVYYIAARKA